jgi:hypothetical protein
VTATVFLRPIHAWFFFWERIVPSLYRVIATGLAALSTAALLTAVDLHPLLAAPISLAVWIGLAIAQEHDDRVLMPPDRAFVSALTDALSPAPPALTVDQAHGPRRSRSEAWDTLVVLSASGAQDHPLAGMLITVERSEVEGWMRLEVLADASGAFEPIEERLRERAKAGLAERIEQAQSPAADAQAIASALAAAYW